MTETVVPIPRGPPRTVGLRLLGDERLARRAAGGDRQAFAAIYDRHHQGIYRFCRSILGNPEDAADALQNTMLAALGALPGERRTITLKPWLYRIAHNESITLLRRRRPEAPLADAPERTSPGPESDSAMRERIRELVGDLGALPDRQRGALVMRELSGFAYAEVAAALGLSEAAAKQAVYEARLGLHDMTEGRAMRCETVRRSISEHDGRRLRGRKLRAHLRGCGGCRAFSAAIAQRRASLPALAPPLSGGAAATLFAAVAGGGSQGATGGGMLAGLGAAVGNLGAGAGLKATAAGTVAVAASVGAFELIEHDPGSAARGPGDARLTEPARPAPAAGARTSRDAARAGHAPPADSASPAPAARARRDGGERGASPDAAPGETGGRAPGPPAGATAPAYRPRGAGGPPPVSGAPAGEVPARSGEGAGPAPGTGGGPPEQAPSGSAPTGGRQSSGGGGAPSAGAPSEVAGPSAGGVPTDGPP